MVVAQFLADNCSICYSLNSSVNSRSYLHIRMCVYVHVWCVHIWERVHVMQSLGLSSTP